MNFQSISSYIEKYRSIGEKERSLKKELNAILSDMGCLSSFDTAKLSQKNLSINAHPALKHYMAMNKARIIEELEKKGFGPVLDIL